MQEKPPRIAILLILLTPIRGFSMVDSIFKAGVAAGVFIAITLLIVIGFVLSKIMGKK